MRPARRLGIARFALGLSVGLALSSPLVAVARPGGGQTYRAPPTSSPPRSSPPSSPPRPSPPSGTRGSTTSGTSGTPGTSGTSRTSGGSFLGGLFSPRNDSASPSNGSGDHEPVPEADLYFGLTLKQILFLASILGLGVWLSGAIGRREGRRAMPWTTDEIRPLTDEEKAALERPFVEARAAELARGPLPYQPPDIERERQRVRDVSQAIRFLGGTDDDFSVPVFEDFVTALYHAAHTNRGKGRLDDLAPYLAYAARQTYEALPATRVEAIVVGALTEAAVFAVRAPIREIEAQIVFTANYTETDSDGLERAYVTNELWTLLRSPDVVSRPPEKARTLGCPNCGAPIGAHGTREPGAFDLCPFCHQNIDTGAFDWRVVDIRIRLREPQEGIVLGEAEEIGTDYPTVIDEAAQTGLERLQARDPSQTWPAFVARVVHIFDTFQRAWSAGDVTPMRPYLTDTLFEAQPRHLEAYSRRGLRNIVEDVKTSFIELARVTHDRYFDAITVRIHASGLDYTQDPTGNIVSGSRKTRRHYTEYWTFLRSAAHTGAPNPDLLCPSCGAPVSINMAGRCDHCNVKITSGDFDWVLSRIEQDESYRA